MLSHSISAVDLTKVMFAVLLAAVALLPDLGHAASMSSGSMTSLPTNDGIVGTICSALDELQGPVARGLAAIGIVFLGFSLFLGKISWGLALALAIGIGAVFGAPQIVAVLSDGNEACAS